MSKTPLADELRARRLAREAKQASLEGCEARSDQWLAADERRRAWVAEQVAEQSSLPAPPKPKTLQRVLWVSLLPIVIGGALVLTAGNPKKDDFGGSLPPAVASPAAPVSIKPVERASEEMLPPKGRGMTDEDVDRLTTYAVALGRAAGCALPVAQNGQRVEAWVRRTASENERAFYVNLLQAGVLHHRDQQRAGDTPDSCDRVAASYQRIEWP